VPVEKICCIEGCEEPRVRSTNTTRCREHYREWRREYYQRPEVKAAHLESQRKYQARPEVKEAKADAARLRKYGITAEEYLIMLERQDEQCATCGGDGPLEVDHCHTEGHVRGLLCGSCNLVLGKVQDNPETLEAMIDYVS
jgi:hypothetical protein